MAQLYYQLFHLLRRGATCRNDIPKPVWKWQAFALITSWHTAQQQNLRCETWKSPEHIPGYGKGQSCGPYTKLHTLSIVHLKAPFQGSVFFTGNWLELYICSFLILSEEKQRMLSCDFFFLSFFCLSSSSCSKHKQHVDRVSSGPCGKLYSPWKTPIVTQHKRHLLGQRFDVYSPQESHPSITTGMKNTEEAVWA